MKLRRIISIIFTILVMIAIFIFSSQTGSESGNLSNKITNLFIDIFVKNYDNYDKIKQNDIFSTVSLVVRKSAHMTEYGILAVLVFSIFFDFKLQYRYLLSIGIAFLYALTDEFHQTFISNRSGAFTDVLIDTCGSLIFVSIASICSIMYKKHTKIKKELEEPNKVE